ncbi:MAG: DNA repair protein RecN [Gammaproteobacteria bacterium]|nr:DNA repair protein RecN [Gammaproteobacteria bacterium]
MLTGLYIRDFAIVRHLELSLRGGFTVLTGETGAGKSILIDALSQLLGARADTTAIRPDCSKAEIIATFELQPEHSAGSWLTHNELDDDGNCVIRRILYRDKATKAFINGRPVPVQMLRELGAELVDIHGQHEHQSLLQGQVQRQVLDAYGSHGATIKQLEQCFARLRNLQTRMETLSGESADRRARIELLRHQCAELAALQLGPHDVVELENEHKRLAHANELLEGIQYASQTLYEADDGTVGQLLARATQRLEALTNFDHSLEEVVALLAEATVRIEDAVTHLRHHLSHVELDPERLHWVEQRLGQLHDIARKHRTTPDGLVRLTQELQTELTSFESTDTDLEQLQHEIESLQAKYDTLANKLSQQRRGAAKKLCGKVSKQMHQLGMAGGKFSVELQATAQPTSHGKDRIQFQVNTNRAQAIGPLSKIASGGELSRISLAIQVVAAGVANVPTLIFDEVDAGIGGGIAEIVGNRLRELGSCSQVLCVTHLPQVASQGNHHLLVTKRTDDDVEVTIHELGDTQRVEEIARMLGGLELTDQSLAHAEEMLHRAAG